MKEIEEIRKRLKENPDAYIGDIEAKINKRYIDTLKRDKERVLKTWFVSLYNYDYEALQRDLCKCIVMNPNDEVSKEDRVNLLKALWLSCQHLFPYFDYSVLFDEINTVITSNKELEDWEEKPPFI